MGLAALSMASAPIAAGDAESGASALRTVTALQPASRGASAEPLPIVLRARELRARPEVDAQAIGEVEFRRDGLVIRADRLDYTQVQDLAVARGNVRISREGLVLSGPELQLHVQNFEGFLLEPRFEFTAIGAGGRAERLELLGEARGRAIATQYTSCPWDGSGDPEWLLTTGRLTFDRDANEGIAEDARLTFLGVPILVLPMLSFPISDERKSGWLPPTVGLDNRSGFGFGLPYYWNIAPNRDATLTPKVATKRGLGLEAEFRYLERAFEGAIDLDLLPDDRVAEHSRYSAAVRHEGTFDAARYALRGVRVSDDDWWKDFPRSTGILTPRLLPLVAEVERPLGLGGVQGSAYARIVRWQVMQSPDAPIDPPYHRSPQIGVRAASALQGFDWSLETEVNHFTLADAATSSIRPAGLRWHALGAVARPWREPGWRLLPRLSFNAAAYDLEQPLPGDGRSRISRMIPTASVDSGLEFERRTEAFGRPVHQSLEPRLMYVYTPYREQSDQLAFDSAPKDFNFSSIFSENAFSGIDRVSDANQLTAGITTRLVDLDSGVELLRLGIVQRYNIEPQRNAPLEEPQRRFSDVLLLGSTGVLRDWLLDASVQYNADVQRTVRSILSARYSPGPFRTVGATYRLTRDARDPLSGIDNEQLALGWQWPLASIGRQGRCGGQLYTVGRVNYSVTDSRVTDSILGFEFDAGCWIGRIVAERLSTGRAEATTRLMLQLELVGLSRLGTNPLKALKENIPGYRLLRDERDAPSRNTFYD
jgi:LPS-assembly protein